MYHTQLKIKKLKSDDAHCGLCDLAQILQVPSLLTMHAPTGFFGVQSFMNNGHSAGLILPTITRWHLQPGCKSTLCSTFTPYLR
jgi:hypothetical protein